VSGNIICGIVPTQHFCFRGVKTVSIWLNKVIGPPDIHITAAQIGLDANKYYDYLIGIQNRGIYVMKPKSSESFGATGHATLWAGLDCIGGKNYFGAASDVYIWKLPQSIFDYALFNNNNPLFFVWM
jgi:hypothetical protein